jgi:hypothetical protein
LRTKTTEFSLVFRVSALFLQEAEGPHYADFFDAPHDSGEGQNLPDESESDWMEVGENSEDAAEGKFGVEEESCTKKVR